MYARRGNGYCVTKHPNLFFSSTLDLLNYVLGLRSLGVTPPALAEFIVTSRVNRKH
jgi:hypothetical protein